MNRTFARGLVSARVAKLALAVLACAFVVTHVIANYTESVNWDEFALMQRAERTIATGHVQGGGRPGLGTLALVPFVHECTSSMDAVHAARIGWAVITLGLLAGLFVFLLRATRRNEHAWHAAALGTGLLALVPTFVKWSLHVRTDQPAIAAALWGGVALFASAGRIRWSVVAGMLFAVGYCCSQKAVYLVPLVGLVVAGDLYIEGAIERRRELLRVAGVTAGAIFGMLAYRYVVPLFYATSSAVSVDAGLNLFAFYRQALGYRVYWAMLPTLVPHLVLLGLIVVAAIRALWRGTEHRRSLLVALAIAASGLAVGKFHAAAFPYFWMTLGVFFATAIAIGWAGICDSIPRARVVLAVLVWIALAINAVRAAIASLEDSQRIQRDTLGFVERNFDTKYRSYDTHGAMFCRSDPDPIPGFMVSSIMARFGGPNGKQAIADFIGEFRTRPIAIVMIPNQTGSYPAEVTELWKTSYQLYYGAVRVAGWHFEGTGRRDFEVIVPGRYRWRTRNGEPARIAIDGQTITTIDLAVGAHVAELVDDANGMLVLDVPEPPWLGDTPFYSTRDTQRWHEARARTHPPPIFR